jgi:hypothetical protein
MYVAGSVVGIDLNVDSDKLRKALREFMNNNSKQSSRLPHVINYTRSNAGSYTKAVITPNTRSNAGTHAPSNINSYTRSPVVI